MILSRWMDKKNMVHIYSGILLGHKRNTFDSVAVKQMNLEPLFQSEVSQKEKNKYHVLTHVYGIQENSTDEPRREGTACGHSRGRRGWDKLRKQHWHTYTITCKTESGKLLYNTRRPAWYSVISQGVGWREERGYICFYIIMADLHWTSQVAQVVKNLPANQETQEMQV